MSRLIHIAFAVTTSCSLAFSGCDAAKEDAAAKWDGTETLPSLPYKAAKKASPKAPTEVKKLRGFTVPTP